MVYKIDDVKKVNVPKILSKNQKISLDDKYIITRVIEKNFGDIFSRVDLANLHFVSSTLTKEELQNVLIRLYNN
jgi:hypothetical protein